MKLKKIFRFLKLKMLGLYNPDAEIKNTVNGIRNEFVSYAKLLPEFDISSGISVTVLKEYMVTVKEVLPQRYLLDVERTGKLLLDQLIMYDIAIVVFYIDLMYTAFIYRLLDVRQREEALSVGMWKIFSMCKVIKKEPLLVIVLIKLYLQISSNANSIADKSNRKYIFQRRENDGK